MPLECGAGIGQFRTETSIAVHNRSPTWKHFAFRRRAEPITKLDDGALGVIVVPMNVLTGNVRNVFLKAVAFSVEDQACLPPLGGRTEALAPQEEAEFERHIETRQPGARVGGYEGNVMYAV